MPRQRGSRILLGLFTLGALCLLLPGSLALASDWYNWRGPQATGSSPERGLPADFDIDPNAANNNLVWKAPYGGRSTPLVLNGRVYVNNSAGDGISEQERVMCFDADTGKLLWEKRFNVFFTDIVSVRLGWTNLAADPKTGNVYWHGTQGLFVCFNKDGKILWQRSLTEEFGRITGYGGRVTSPTVDEDLVIIGMLNSSWGDMGKGGNRWLAMNKNDGSIVWWSEPAEKPRNTYYSVPVVAVIDGVRLLITGGADGGVHAMKVRTGEPVWSLQYCAGAINVAPVVEGQYVYITHGDENPELNNNKQGRILCLDAANVKDGKPAKVWEVDGVAVRYCSPIIKDGKLYVCDDTARMFCYDGKTGKKLWEHRYGRNAKGSPVYADDKIYVGDINSKFHILDPLAKKKNKSLHEQFFPGMNGQDVELNGSPAVANGRVYFLTSDELYCIGKKDGRAPADPLPPEPKENRDPDQKAAFVQVIPADVAVHPGETVQFKARTFDKYGVLIGETKAEWSLPQPPLPPKAKTQPPALKGEMDAGQLRISNVSPAQQGYVEAKVGGLKGRARVRVAPRLPYTQDFEKVPDGAVPAGWVNTQGKFLVTTLADGNKVLKKVNTISSPLVAKANAFIGLPTMKNYTIEADVLGTQLGPHLPDMGVINTRYTLWLTGATQSLRLTSWDAIPRVDKTIVYPWQPKVWYRLKLTVATENGKAVARGKVWQRDAAEPKDWTVEVTDPTPNLEGAPGLHGYVTGFQGNAPGNDVQYDNVRVTPNKNFFGGGGWPVVRCLEATDHGPRTTDQEVFPMKEYPALRRWAATLATLTVFTSVVILAASSGGGKKEEPKQVEGDKPRTWPMFGGQLSRNMVNTTDRNTPVKFDVEDPNDKQIVWSADLGSKAYGGPVVADGKVFIGTNNEKPRDPKITGDKGIMMCFDAQTGKFLWQHVHKKLPGGQVSDWPKEGICSSPVVEGKKLWYVSNRCEVVCSTTDGKILWTLDMIGKLDVFPHNLAVCSPLIAGDALFVVTANGVDEGHINIPAPKAPSFLALNKNDGKVIWQNNDPSANLVAKAGKKIDKQEEVAIKKLVNAGLLLMHGQWSNPVYATANGQPQVIFPGGDGWLRSFDPKTGDLIWKFDCNPKQSIYILSAKGTRNDFISTPVVHENKVYIGVGQDPEHDEGISHFWCIDITKKGDVSTGTIPDKNGKPVEVFDTKHPVNKNSALVWHYGEDPLKPVPAAWKKGRNYVFGRTMSTAAVHDGLVYISELAGYLHCLDAQTGEQYWTHYTKSAIWGSPYWVDNKIYLGNDDDTVFVFQHGKQKKLLAENGVGGKVRATPVVANGVLYVVSENKIFAIVKK